MANTVSQKQTRKYRGRQLIMLRQVIALGKRVFNNQLKYTEPPTNRRHLPDELADAMNTAQTQAELALQEKWPPDTSQQGRGLDELDDDRADDDEAPPL